MKEPSGILYFSPTKTTETICRTIAKGMNSMDPPAVDVTDPELRKKVTEHPEILPEKVEHWIIGAPVYLGKLPVQFKEAMKTVRGHEKKATAVVVYGNRDYGVALRELVEILTRAGFRVVSAGAFIGQHSYSGLFPIALNRPDVKDLEEAQKFGKESLDLSGTFSPEEIPVQLDMVSRSKNYSYPLRAVFKESSCTQCGNCAPVCPTGIIDEQSGEFRSEAKRKECVGCMACVSVCEDDARIIKAGPLMYRFLKTYLKKAASQRLEPLTLFPN